MTTDIVTNEPNAKLAAWSYGGGTLDSLYRFAKALTASNLVPKGLAGNPAATMYVMLAGLEQGARGPIEAIRHFNVIDGKVAASGEWMRAKMLEGGCKLAWPTLTDRGATLKVTRPDGEVGEFSFTEADAKQAGLIPAKPFSGWAKYPQDMYSARATARAARAFCPDMIRGVSYTREELGLDEETGEGAVGAAPGSELASSDAARTSAAPARDVEGETAGERLGAATAAEPSTTKGEGADPGGAQRGAVSAARGPSPETVGRGSGKRGPEGTTVPASSNAPAQGNRGPEPDGAAAGPAASGPDDPAAPDQVFAPLDDAQYDALAEAAMNAERIHKTGKIAVGGDFAKFLEMPSGYYEIENLIRGGKYDAAMDWLKRHAKRLAGAR